MKKFQKTKEKKISKKKYYMVEIQRKKEKIEIGVERKKDERKKKGKQEKETPSNLNYSIELPFLAIYKTAIFPPSWLNFIDALASSTL